MIYNEGFVTHKTRGGVRVDCGGVRLSSGSNLQIDMQPEGCLAFCSHHHSGDGLTAHKKNR